MKSLQPDLAYNTSSDTTDGKLNKFSVTLKNTGKANVTSPFVLNIKLGDGTNIVKSLKVLNPLSSSRRSNYENLESDNGSFDILVKNYRLRPGQSNTITYWFVLPSDYNSEVLPVVYTWDTTNAVTESNESNRVKQQFNIQNRGFLKEDGFGGGSGAADYGYGYSYDYEYGYAYSTGEQYWCLNLQKQCYASSPGDTTCDGRLYPSQASCFQTSATYDWMPVEGEKGIYYILVTSTPSYGYGY